MILLARLSCLTGQKRSGGHLAPSSALRGVTEFPKFVFSKLSRVGYDGKDTTEQDWRATNYNSKKQKQDVLRQKKAGSQEDH